MDAILSCGNTVAFSRRNFASGPMTFSANESGLANQSTSPKRFENLSNYNAGGEIFVLHYCRRLTTGQLAGFPSPTPNLPRGVPRSDLCAHGFPADQNFLGMQSWRDSSARQNRGHDPAIP